MANVIEVIFQGVDQISQNTSKISKSFSALNKTAVALGAALAAAFSVAAIKNFAIEQIKAADAMLDLTRRIGGTVESLSELEHVAEISNVRFGTMTRGLEQMSRRISEAADRSGAARGALDELGLSASSLEALSIDQQFEHVAEALSRVEGASDRTRLAVKLFEGEGVALLQTMQDGAAGIRKLREEAVQLGRRTTEQAEAASRATDAMTRMNTAVELLAGNMALKLAPAIAATVEGFNDLFFPSEMLELQNRLNNIREQIEAIKNPQQQGAAGPGGFLAADIAVDQEHLAELQADLIEVVKQMSAIQNGVDTSGILPITIDSAGLVAKFEKALEEMRGQGQKTIDRLFEHFTERYATAEQEVAAEMERFDLVDHLFPAEEQARLREAIRAPLFEGIDQIDLDELIDLDRLDAKLAEVLDHTSDWEKQMEAIADEAARSMQRAFSDFLFDPFEDGLKGMVAGFLDAIRRMLADEGAVRFFKMLSGGGSGGTGLFAGIVKGIGALFGGGKGGTGPLGPPRAHGGFTVPGSLHPVNEREPEFLLTRGRSEVVPLSKMAAAGAGGSRVFSPTTNFNLMTAPLSRDELEEFSQGREDQMFARFKRMLMDDGVD